VWQIAGRRAHQSGANRSRIPVRKFLTVVLVPLGAWLVLYAIDPALSVIVLLIAGLVALLVKLARSERASPNRRVRPNRRDWTNREAALFREFSNEVREYQDRLQRSKGWGKYRRH
jgi:hypothetical protein